MGYNTENKSVLINCFESNPDKQFSASEISSFLAVQGIKIALATIYRNLEHLEREGVVRKFIDENGKQACWQYNYGDCSQHYHLKCSECGKIIHLDCDLVDKLEKHIIQKHGFSINRETTIFYGKCDACRLKNGENL